MTKDIGPTKIHILWTMFLKSTVEMKSKLMFFPLWNPPLSVQAMDDVP